MRVGIIGAGLMGMALAERLAGEGHRVHVFERTEQAGGLATWHDFGPFVWDRFYHVILPSDRALIEFMRRIGLGDCLQWRSTRTGYFVGGRLWSLSNGMEFLRFPLLGLTSKIRLAWTILYCSRIRDWQRLEEMNVEEFLVRLSGRATFEVFWKPLLLAKLGEAYRRVSGVFIWTYVRRLFSARDPATQKEQLGYVSGGYRGVFDVLIERVKRSGGAVHTGVDVECISPGINGSIDVSVANRCETFDRVVFTGPADVMRRIVHPSLVDVPPSGKIEYLGVICLAIVTKRPLVPFYIVNISDQSIPFTGVIGMSSLVSTEETGGLYLTYCPKYVLSSDDLFSRSDPELLERFMAGLRSLVPALDSSDITYAQIHRAARVQPLQVVGYSKLVQQARTRSTAFFVLNTTQFVSSTLNNNEVICAVDGFLDTFRAQFAEPAGSAGQPRVSGAAARGAA